MNGRWEVEEREEGGGERMKEKTHVHVELARKKGSRRRVQQEQAIQQLERGEDEQVVLAIYSDFCHFVNKRTKKNQNIEWKKS